MKRLIAALAVTAAILAGCAQPQATPPAQGAASQAKVTQISTADLQQRLSSGQPTFLIDVRTPDEWKEGHIAQAKLMPLQNLENEIKGVKKDQEIVIICRSGNRSMQAVEILGKMGYTNLVNVQGGMLAWKGAVTK